MSKNLAWFSAEVGHPQVVSWPDLDSLFKPQGDPDYLFTDLPNPAFKLLTIPHSTAPPFCLRLYRSEEFANRGRISISGCLFNTPAVVSCTDHVKWVCSVKTKTKKTCFLRRQRVVTHFVYLLFFLFLQCLRRFKALGDKDTKYGKKLNVSDHFGSWCFAEDFCWYNLQCLILTV